MKRRIRTILCAELMFDMNALPTFSWYCHEHSIECDRLDAYIADGDKTKTYLLAINNGQNIRVEEDAPAWLREYNEGMRKIMDKVVDLNLDLYQFSCKSKQKRYKDVNIEGTTVNYVMYGLAKMAQMTPFDYLIE